MTARNTSRRSILGGALIAGASSAAAAQTAARHAPARSTLNEGVKRIEFFGASPGASGDLDCTRAFSDALEYAASRGAEGLTLDLGAGRHRIEQGQIISKAARFRVQGVGGRIASPHRRPHQIGGTDIVNATGGVLFDVIEDVSAPGDFHTCGIEFEGVGFSQSSPEAVALRFQTQWAQPRIRRSAFLGGKHAYTFAGQQQPYDVECEDVFFYGQDVACFLPDTGQSDYLHMVWRNCTWRYCGTAVESEIANSLHFQGGLVEANGVGLKLAGAIALVELKDGLHFEQQRGLDLQVMPGKTRPQAVTKMLRIDGVSATWNKRGDQQTQIQIDDALNTILQGNSLLGGRNAQPGDRWTSVALNQPADRAVWRGLNAIDGEVRIAERGLRVSGVDGRPGFDARTRYGRG